MKERAGMKHYELRRTFESKRTSLARYELTIYDGDDPIRTEENQFPTYTDAALWAIVTFIGELNDDNAS